MINKFHLLENAQIDGAIQITLPFPPSANRYWRKFRNIMVTSTEALQYKRDAKEVLENANIEPLVGTVLVCLDIYRPRKCGDLDNFLKVCLDSMNGIAYHDDKQIIEIRARRFDDKQRPRVEVLIVNWEASES